MASDSFTNSNGTALTTHDDSVGGVTWADVSINHPVADAEIQSNTCSAVGGNQDFGARNTDSTEDYSQITFVGGDHDNNGKNVCVRASATSEGYYATFSGLGDTTPGIFDAVSIYSHGESWVDSGNGSWDQTDDLTLRLTASGTGTVTLNLWISVNGGSFTQVITDAEDTGSSIDSGNPGFWAAYISETESDYRFDDWTDGTGGAASIIPLATTHLMNMMRG